MTTVATWESSVDAARRPPGDRPAPEPRHDGASHRGGWWVADLLTDGPAEGCLWPNAEQQLLLAAALSPSDAEAHEAWRAWRARVDVAGEFHRAVVRLLPLVYQNLLRLGIRDDVLGRLKGVWRRTWYESHRLLAQTGPAVGALCDAGLDVLLLKGAPLAAKYYESPALRPMSDLDVCVRPRDARAAVDVLRGLGWRPWRSASDDHLRFFHALQFTHPDGGELDLHWHVMNEAVGTDLDAALWTDTEPFDHAGLAVRQLAPTSLLLHTVVHGVRWNEEPPVRWIPDALYVLRKRGASVDWDRFVALARHARVTYRTRLGLEYLVRHFAAPVPATVRDRLARVRPSLPERLERAVVLRDTAALQRRAAGWHLSLIVELARQIHPLWRPVAFAVAYPHYLRYRHDLGGRRELLPLLVRGVARRLWPPRRRPA